MSMLSPSCVLHAVLLLAVLVLLPMYSAQHSWSKACLRHSFLLTGHSDLMVSLFATDAIRSGAGGTAEVLMVYIRLIFRGRRYLRQTRRLARDSLSVPGAAPNCVLSDLQVISEPMCLQQMSRNLGENVYGARIDGHGLALFAYHLRLIVDNCFTFHGVSDWQPRQGQRRNRGHGGYDRPGRKRRHSAATSHVDLRWWTQPSCPMAQSNFIYYGHGKVWNVETQVVIVSSRDAAQKRTTEKPISVSLCSLSLPDTQTLGGHTTFPTSRSTLVL